MGITGILISFPDSVGADRSNDSGMVETGDESRAIVTNIGNYLQLRDTYGPDHEHDGVYGDGDPGDSYVFYLNNQYNNFGITMRNMMTTGYFRYVNTTLRSPMGSMITVTDKYYNLTFVNNGETDYYYYDFKLGTTGTIGGKYELDLDVEMVIYSTGPPTIQTGTIKFEILLSSRMDSAGSEHTLRAMDKTATIMVPLYTGARNQILTLDGVNSNDQNLDGLTFTLSLPSYFYFTPGSNVATIAYTYTYVSGYDPLWRLESAGSYNLAAGDYYGTFKVVYHISDTKITEEQIPVTIVLSYSPVISLKEQVPESEIGVKTDFDRYVANAEIYQGTTSEKFSITFVNEGNLDLKDVTVELYTDNAAYFFKAGFYYDEGNNAFKQSFSNVVELGDMTMGQEKTEEFPTEVIKNLPPGLYKIPVKYDARYNTGDIIDIGLDESTYHYDIMLARSTQNEGYLPFILIEVIEGDDAGDYSEPDMTARSENDLKAGMNNVMLEVLLTNLENYQLNSVNAEIITGGSSPLQMLNSNDMYQRKVGAQEIDFTMYGANDPINSNQFLVTFFVDIYEGAKPGLHGVPITITCLDPFNVERMNTVNLQLVINPVPPRCFVAGITTTDIEQNGNFTLSVLVRNSGGSDAMNVSAMFNASSNLFKTSEYIKGPMSIPKNKDAEFEFNIWAGDVSPGMTYAPSVLLYFQDSLGNEFGFDPSTEFPIPLFAKGRNPNVAPQCMVTDVSSTVIKPNNIFTLTVKVYNAGGSTAKDVQVMFNGSSNLFSATESVLDPKNINANSEAEFTFTITAGELEEGKTYHPTILLNYEDDLGNEYTFEDQENKHVVDLRAKEVEPEEPSAWDIYLGLAIVIFGILILISVVVFSVFHYKAVVKSEKIKKEEQAPPPAREEQEPVYQQDQYLEPAGQQEQFAPVADHQPATPVETEVLPPAPPQPQPTPKTQPVRQQYQQQ